MVEVRGYVDGKGNQPFAAWFGELDYITSARIDKVLRRLEEGNFSNVKGVGAGVLECRIDFGPGYRVYFGKDGDRLVILLGGGSKTRQANDIATAKQRWSDYKRRKRQELN